MVFNLSSGMIEAAAYKLIPTPSPALLALPQNQQNSTSEIDHSRYHSPIVLHPRTNASRFCATRSSLPKHQDAHTACDFFVLLSASASVNSFSTSFFLRAFSLHLSLSSTETEELISAKLALILRR